MRKYLIDSTQIKTNIIVCAALLIGTAAGGIYYFRRRKGSSQITERKPRKNYVESCNVCFQELEVKDITRCTKCCNCGKYICRGDKCSIWLPKPGGWECQLCNLSNASHKRTSAWVNEQLTIEPNLTNSYSARSEIFIPIHQEISSTIQSNYETTSQATSLSNIREKIREHVEDILAKILGGSLDDISVAQLSKHKKYLTLFDKYHSNLSEYLLLLENSIKKTWNDLPVNENECTLNDASKDASHLKLKSLIQTIIQDTLNLPSLLDYSGVKDDINNKKNANLPYFEAKRYQELLATAVLNKIIDSNNMNKKNGNSDEIYNGADTSSVLSLDSGSDSSVIDPTEYNNQNLNEVDEIDNESILSDYLAAHTIPLPSLENSDCADFELAEPNGIEDTWETNWLFKKRKNGTSASSVGMLVPAPKEDVRTLIGDKTADEMSDLSEAGSDFEDDDIDLDNPNLFYQNERIKNNQVIGGKNSAGLFDEVIDHTSLISKTSSDENQPIIIETLNDCVTTKNILPDKENFLNDNEELNGMTIPEEEAVNADVTINSVESYSSNLTLNDFDEILLSPPGNFKSNNVENSFNLEKTLSQEFGNKKDFNENNRIPSLENKLILYNNANVTNQVDSNIISNHFTNENSDNITSSIRLCDEDVDESLLNFLPGSIAERERKKWYNAVEMPNNPYAPEALRRRLSIGNEKPFDIPIINYDKNKEKNAPITDQKPNLIGEEQPNFERYSRDYYVNETLQSPKHFVNTTTPIIQSQDTEEKSLSEDTEETEQQNCRKTDFKSPYLNEIQIDDNIDSTYSARLVQIEDDSNDSLLFKSIEEFKSLEPDIDSNNNFNSSLATSEDSDIMRIYDLNTQEEIKIKGKDVKINKLDETNDIIDLKYNSEKTLNLMKRETIKSAVLKSSQPKRKIIEPSQILMESNNICSVNSSKKDVIEADIKYNMPSVKELVKTFLTSPEKKRLERPKSLPANFCSDIYSDNNILNNIINLKKALMEQDYTKNENFLVAERPLSPIVEPGKLQENITFFENLKKC